ncbi:MAG: 50S ribosomal protein L32 [Terriglobia bacterium]
MPNPKRRHSHARQGKRRAHHFLVATSLVECRQCHEQKLPHRICRKCGYYEGRKVIAVKEKK